MAQQNKKLLASQKQIPVKLHIITLDIYPFRHCHNHIGMAHGHLLGYNSRAMHETHQRCIDKDDSGEQTKQHRGASSARTNIQLATEHKNALIIPGYTGANVANYYNLEDKKQGNIPIMLLFFFEPALHQSKQSNNHCYRMKMYLSKVDLKK
jgi:hypothetical protein